MKLLSIIVPCYNSEDYLQRCIDTLIVGGNEVEILIVDDGSTDLTLQMAIDMQSKHSEIIRVIKREKNGGHGAAVMTGIKNARGQYVKVVDSDDWVDVKAYQNLISTLKGFSANNIEVDLIVTNYVYCNAKENKQTPMHYIRTLPEKKVICWDETRHFPKGKYMLMHALTYRTSMLRDSGIQLPEHTFYVDNLYAYIPLKSVKTLYYLNVNLYQYYIGRDDQSVNEKVMIDRIDQQIRVNKMMIEHMDLKTIESYKLRRYMLNYIEIVTIVSSILLIKAGSREALEKKKELWSWIENNNEWIYKRLRYNILGLVVNLQGRFGRALALCLYKLARQFWGFN